MNYLDIILDAMQNGGGTYTLYGDNGTNTWERAEYGTGYLVSLPFGIENLPGGALSPDVLYWFVEAKLDDPGHGLHNLGLWVDERGNWSIDNTMWVTELADAIWFGKRFNQRAIWSVEDGQALDLTSMSALVAA